MTDNKFGTFISENTSLLYSPKDPENIIVATNEETKLVSAGDASTGFSQEPDYFVSRIAENKLPRRCTPESPLESIKVGCRHTNRF